MAKDIKFNIKLNVDGRDVVVGASTDVKEMARQLGIAHKESRTFLSSFRDYAGVNVAFQGMNAAIQGLVSQLGEFTRASAVQEQVETQLATAMRNTMGASDADSLKKLAKNLRNPKTNSNFAVRNPMMVAWMSGLVTGLQNQAQRFESACDLNDNRQRAEYSVVGDCCFSTRIAVRQRKWYLRPTV